VNYRPAAERLLAATQPGIPPALSAIQRAKKIAKSRPVAFAPTDSDASDGESSNTLPDILKLPWESGTVSKATIRNRATNQRKEKYVPSYPARGI